MTYFCFKNFKIFFLNFFFDILHLYLLWVMTSQPTLLGFNITKYAVIKKKNLSITMHRIFVSRIINIRAFHISRKLGNRIFKHSYYSEVKTDSN